MSVRRWAPIFGLVLGLLAACGDDESTASLVFELAPARADVGTDGCSASPTVEPAPLPDAVDHVWVSICRYGGVGCEAVPLVATDGDHGAATPDLLIPLDASRAFEVDGKLGSGEHRVEVVACVGTEPFARGVADGVRLGSGSARVRLYRFGQSSCAGPRRAGNDVAMPAARALHESVALPNGDVLVFGGITGDAPPVPSGPVGMVSWQGAPLQRSVEVYRPSEERFLDVGGDDFGRVMFAARLLSTTSPDGPFRIRVVGGFEVEGDAAAIRFDASQGRTFYGAPLLPSANAMVADSVDLVYDPDGPSLAVEPAAIPGNPRAGANRVGQFAPDVPAAVVLGITDMETGTADSPRPGVSGAYWWLGQDGMRQGAAETLLASRFGHTVSTVPIAGGALVWGGNVAESDPAVVQTNAGELLRPGSASTAVTGGGLSMLPEPVALHTATAVMETSVIIAGGLRVGCSGATCMGRGFSTNYASPSLSVFRYEAGGFVPVPVDVATPFEPSFLHAAVPLTSAGRANAAVLLGGATATAGSRMVPSDQIVRVASTDVGRFGTTPLGDVPPDGLLHARWGHSAVSLGEERLLVTGGIHIDADGRLATLGQAEVVSYGAPPSPNPCAGASAMDGGPGFDAGRSDSGPGFDSGPPADAGTPAADSGGADGGVSPVDSGV